MSHSFARRGCALLFAVVAAVPLAAERPWMDLDLQGFRSLGYDVYSTLGGVLTVKRKPLFSNAVQWEAHKVANPKLDPDLWLVWDADRDGAFEHKELVRDADLSAHASMSGDLTDG